MKRLIIIIALSIVSMTAHAEQRWIKILDVYMGRHFPITSGCTGGYNSWAIGTGGWNRQQLECGDRRIGIPKELGWKLDVGYRGKLYTVDLPEKIGVMNDILMDITDDGIKIAQPMKLRAVAPRSRRDQRCVSDNDVSMDPGMAMPALSLCPYIITD